MEKPNETNRVLYRTAAGPTADASAKRLFSLKQVAGYFLKECLPEYRGCALETIVKKYLAAAPCDAAADGAGAGPEYVRRLGTELLLPHDDILHLDLVFEALTPSGGRQLVEMEMRNDSDKVDRLIGRGMLYAYGLGLSE